ncbi:vacuolar protein sorting-associated protein 51 homolog [Thrips palmi]|uniref:Vacuolar protein sorting-associated protein 51 homolog n=1 Tax=Thrips palmi TaxID=161013 RepID=A0A6P9AG75_THRPL|nr:vacuolar protein sorting-associated protein 51 homolog [Thrips palmi]
MADFDDIDNPYNINGPNFCPEMYVQKLLKGSSLKQVMDNEAEIVRDTQSLHSDMQTLVYENYNKFISATDTVKKMKSDFRVMEDEMEQLAANMEEITKSSQQISSTLQETRQQFTKLLGVHSLLKRLQFLFKLPAKLSARIKEEQYAQAVQDYIHAQRVLERYGNMASFQGIQKDCEIILGDLKQRLRDQFKNKEASAKDLAKAVDLLLQLSEPADQLCAEFLAHAETRLEEQLGILDSFQEQDLLEFVDMGSKGFLSDLCLVVASYNDMFINRHTSDVHASDDFETLATGQLSKFVMERMEKYFALVSSRVEKQQEVGETLILVRALDRFHRRLQAINTLFQHTDFTLTGTNIALKAGRRQCKIHLQALKGHFWEALTRVRQTLAAPKAAGQDKDGPSLPELLTSVVLATRVKVKNVLQDLLVFLQPDLMFAMKPMFREAFCVDGVREGLVVGFMHHLTATARGFCAPGHHSVPPALLLLLSKMCLDFESTTVRELLSHTDDCFDAGVTSSSAVTPPTELCANMKAAAQDLLNHYVRMQGLTVSQMLRKSVETRDWLHTIEPRNVRAVMKRVVEDVAAMDAQVGLLYEEGQRAERSSDSSRRTHSMSVSRQFRPNWSSYASSQLDQSAIATNIHKLFSERIEIFSSVGFSKVSILTGIIKIGLKTFIECVRLRTFSRFGLQQIQVDTHYLQLYLWRFVADENLVLFLLDEVLTSTVHRCLDPVLMEPSVMDIICERG